MEQSKDTIELETLGGQIVKVEIIDIFYHKGEKFYITKEICDEECQEYLSNACCACPPNFIAIKFVENNNKAKLFILDTKEMLNILDLYAHKKQNTSAE